MKIEDVFGDLPAIETERTILRKMTELDANDMFEYASDEEVARYTIWYAHKTIEDTRAFVQHVLSEYRNRQIAPWGIQDKQTGKLIGTCGFVYWNVDHARAELGYALSRSYWNRGLMSEAVRSVIEFGFDKMKLVRIEARCHPDNIGSARVMEKSGMSFEGVLRKHIFAKGSHQDVKIYSIIKGA